MHLKSRKFATLLLLSAAMAALLLHTGPVRQALTEALRLCGTAVIPALFPFMVLNRILVELLPVRAWQPLEVFMARCFGLSGNCFFPLLLSFLGGYPAGTAAAVALYRRGGLSRQDCQRLLTVCNNSGPGFFVSYLGGVVFQAPQLGAFLYSIHVLSALLCARLFARPRSVLQLRKVTSPPLPRLAPTLLAAVGETCGALFRVCALVMLFSLFPVFLEGLHLPSVVEVLFLGTLELTSGCARLAGLPLSIPLAAFLMGWGGCCVHMQAAGLWEAADLRVSGYYLCKLIHGLLSALFACLLTAPTPHHLLLAGTLTIFCATFPCFRKNMVEIPVLLQYNGGTKG